MNAEYVQIPYMQVKTFLEALTINLQPSIAMNNQVIVIILLTDK